MSTNASIAKVYEDGSVKEITVHMDGYLEGVGRTLSYHYQDANKIDALMELGNISTLGRYVEVAPCLAEYGTKAFEVSYRISGESEQISNDIRSHTIAYHRDRGEELSFYEHDSLEDYYQNVNEDSCMEYAYVNIDNIWYVCIHYYEQGKSRPKLLEDVVNELN